MLKLFEFLKNNRQIRDFFDDFGPQIRKSGAICLLGLVLFAGFSLFSSRSEEPEIESSKIIPDEEMTETVDSVSSGTIFVDIGGAVRSPMLAELPDGSRVDDAIKAAGGLNKDADMSGINRAEFLIDGQKVFVPSIALDEEGNVISAPAASTGTDGSGKVNINTADAEQLQTLNGVGPATAQKIIDYRQSSGRFLSIEDIKNVSGIGDKTYEKLKDSITV